MTLSKANSKIKLRTEYFNLVEKAIHIQRKGDIKAYTKNALQAENIAQKLQALSRGN